MDDEVVEMKPEEIAQRLGQPDGAFQSKETVVIKEGTSGSAANNGDGGEAGGSDKPANTAVQTPDFSKIGVSYFEKMGVTKDFKPVEGEDPVVTLSNHINKQFEEQLPPFTRMVLQNERIQGFNEEEFISQFSKNPANSLTGEAKITEYLLDKYGRFDQEKNPNGLTAEDAKLHLDKLTKIEKLELESKANEHFGSSTSKKMQEYIATKQAAADKAFNDHVENMGVIASRVLENKEVKAIKNVLGVDVTAEELAEFNKVFPSIVTPNKETRLAPLLEWIYNMEDADLYKLSFFLHKKEPYFKQLVEDRVSEAKHGVKKKMNLMPRSANTGQHQGPEEIDSYLLTQPERGQ